MKTLIIILALCAAKLVAAVDLNQAHQLMNDQLDRFNGLLNDQALDKKSKREKLANTVEDVIHFEAIASKALGPHASKLSPSQRDRFNAAFKTTLEKWLVADLMDFEEGSITLSEYIWQPEEQKLLIKTLGREKPGFGISGRSLQRARTDYVLEENEGTWKIVDLTINSVNLALNYRSQIEGLLRRGQSIEEVIELLEKTAKSSF